MKYTIKDVIIDPEDPRIELGAEYYYGLNPTQLVQKANADFERDCAFLTAIRDMDMLPFFMSTAVDSSCIIRKKEPEKRYVSYDFSDPDLRRELLILTAFVKCKNPKGHLQCGLITGFMNDGGGNWMCIIGGLVPQTAEQLMADWEYWNGTPCGKEITE